MPRSKTERAHCPACRAIRPVRNVGTAHVHGQPHQLMQCLDHSCELVWAIVQHEHMPCPRTA